MPMSLAVRPGSPPGGIVAGFDRDEIVGYHRAFGHSILMVILSLVPALQPFSCSASRSAGLFDQPSRTRRRRPAGRDGVQQLAEGLKDDFLRHLPHLALQRASQPRRWSHPRAVPAVIAVATDWRTAERRFWRSCPKTPILPLRQAEIDFKAAGSPAGEFWPLQAGVMWVVQGPSRPS
jgi:hypothetical protein